jgi:riboflavin kinase
MKTATVQGIVSSGQGQAARFVDLPWAKTQIEKLLGFTPYPGTLNVRVTRAEATRLKRVLAQSPGVEIVPKQGFYRARCFGVMIMNKAHGAIITPQTPDYPVDIVEIVAPVHLRALLSLRDGSPVRITITLDADATP